jgi:hypothetical protein
MKKLLIGLVLAAFALTAEAQDVFTAGIKAGINTSKISVNKNDYTPQSINNYLFGAFARINIGRFYLQPEAYYNSKGGEYIDKIDQSVVNKFDLKTVDVPALLGFKIIKQEAINLRIMGGPVFSFETDKSVKGQFVKENIENSFFGWQYGAGVDFLFLTLDARIESPGSSLYDSPDFNTKNSHYVVSLGIKLF